MSLSVAPHAAILKSHRPVAAHRRALLLQVEDAQHPVAPGRRGHLAVCAEGGGADAAIVIEVEDLVAARHFPADEVGTAFFGQPRVTIWYFIIEN